MRFKSWQAVKLLLGQLPNVATNIIKTFRVWLIKIDRLWQKFESVIQNFDGLVCLTVDDPNARFKLH